MQKPCKNNFHRVLIVGSYIVAQIVVFLNLCYNKDVALEHYVVFLSDVRTDCSKEQFVFLLSFMSACAIIKPEILRSQRSSKDRCFSFS